MKARAIFSVALAIVGVALPFILAMVQFGPGERVTSHGPESTSQAMLLLINFALSLVCGVAAGWLMRSSAPTVSDVMKIIKSNAQPA